MFRPQELTRAVWRGNGDWGKPLYFLPAHPAFPVPPSAARAVNHGRPASLSSAFSPSLSNCRSQPPKGGAAGAPCFGVEVGCRGGRVVAHGPPPGGGFFDCLTAAQHSPSEGGLWICFLLPELSSFQFPTCWEVKPGTAPQLCQLPAALPSSRPSPGWPFSALLLDPLFAGP